MKCFVRDWSQHVYVHRHMNKSAYGVQVSFDSVEYTSSCSSQQGHRMSYLLKSSREQVYSYYNIQ